jgi:hypothetical protein
MSLIDPDLFKQKQKELLEKFTSVDANEVSTTDNPQDATVLDEELFNVIVQLFAIQRGLDPTDGDVLEQLQPYARKKMAALDPDDPKATHGAKMLRLLAASDQIGAASTYADALGQDRRSEFSKVQTERATGSRPTPYQEFLKGLVHIHPTIDKEDALRRIEQQKRIYPIYDVCEEWIWVYQGEDDPSKDLPEYKRYKISALGSNLSRVKKELKNPRKPT